MSLWLLMSCFSLRQKVGLNLRSTVLLWRKRTVDKRLDHTLHVKRYIPQHALYPLFYFIAMQPMLLWVYQSLSLEMYCRPNLIVINLLAIPRLTPSRLVVLAHLAVIRNIYLFTMTHTHTHTHTKSENYTCIAWSPVPNWMLWTEVLVLSEK